MTESDNKWNNRFMELAEQVSAWSKDPSTKVGAVIVDENRRVVSTGYNGFARGVNDIPERLENRDVKYKMILHAEENAIMFAKRDLTGCTLYVTSLPPCSHCASLIIQSGIRHVYCPKTEISDRWKESIELTKQIFKEADVTLDFLEKENYLQTAEDKLKRKYTSEDIDEMNKLFPKTAPEYFKDENVDFARPKSIIERYNDASIKPYISIKDLNESKDDIDEAPSKPSIEIGIKGTF